LLRGGVVTACAPDEEQHLEVRVLLDGGHAHAIGPLHAVLLAETPWVAGALHAAERRLQLGGELALHHHQVAAHVDDVDHLLTPDRAYLHARAAGGARPYGLRREREFQQWPRAGFTGSERSA